MFIRRQRHSVLINLTDHCVQLARLGRLDVRPLTIDTFAEVSIADVGSVARWLDFNFNNRSGKFITAYCGFHPAERIFQRDSINVRRLYDREYLCNIVAEHAKIISAKAWHVAALNPGGGIPLSADSRARSAIFRGAPGAAAGQTPCRLPEGGTRPPGLGPGTPGLPGALPRYASLVGYN